MSYKIIYGNAVISLPSTVLENLELADSIDIKTLLCIVSKPEMRTSEAAATISELLQCRRDKVEAAIKYWLSVGVICEDADNAVKSEKSQETSAPEAAAEPETEKKLRDREIPIYSGEEIQALLDADNGKRRLLLSACQKTLGKVFNATEANKVVALSDYLNLSDEHILMLFQYCHDRDKNNVHYVSAMAYNLYDEGVDTVEKFDAYLKRKEAKESFEAKLRSLIGCGERALTTNEKKYIAKWTDEYKFGFDIIKRAFEISCDRGIMKSQFAYMNKILEGWFNKNLTTIEAIDEAERDFAAAKANGEGYGKFDTDEFYGLALKKATEIISEDGDINPEEANGEQDGL